MTKYTYEEFKYKLTEALQELGKEQGVDVKLDQIHKNNGFKDTIIIQRPDQNMAPALRLEDFYNDFCNDNNNNEIREFAAEIITKTLTISPKGLSLDPDHAKEHLMPAVCDYVRNGEWLINEGIPHRLIADDTIAIYPKWQVGPSATVTVTSGVMSMLHMTRDEIMQACVTNATKIGATIIPLEQAIMSMIGGPVEADGNGMIYIAKLNTEANGAAILAVPSLMNNIYKKMGSEDIKIIPSSVYELMIVKGDSADIESLNNIIKEVNSTVVDISDQLGDELLSYDGHELRIASIREAELKQSEGLNMSLCHERRRHHAL